MPRQSRFLLPGVPVHVIQRGNDRSCLFPDDNHRELYLGLVGEWSAKVECQVHAYVLMTNHVHMLMTPASADALPTLMKRMGQKYVQSFNKAHKHTGTRLDGRYRAHMVGIDDRFLTCQRYIELNPVRAGMVRHPGDYSWSSYGSNAWARPSSIVMPHIRYTELGTTIEERCRLYARLVAQGISDQDIAAIRVALKAQLPWGSPAFIAMVENLTGRKAKPSRNGRPPKTRV
jgi:putative transposase